ncbi:MAG TPA: ATP-binding protein [Verrucomicrobiae bacterium]|nr:ATP-binding protein [Verrucomicrobiae bacterium]
MIAIYFYLSLISGLVSLAAAAAVYWRNRFQAIGPIFGLTLMWMGFWCVGFAFYYHPLESDWAMLWAKMTMTASITAHAFWFHTMSELSGRSRRHWLFIVGSYATAALLLIILWSGGLLTNLKSQPHMDHYVEYSARWYPPLMVYLLSSQALGVTWVLQAAWRETGYRRTQLVYFVVAWAIIFLTTSSIIIPLQYEVNIPPFGFFLLPLNLGFLAYVMGKARLADFNVVIARVFLYAVTLVIIAAATLVFLGGTAVASPGFMNQQQLTFAFMVAMIIGIGLTISLPRFLPRAERIMQERMFGGRYGYQDTLGHLVKELSRMPTIDQILESVAGTAHAQMQVSRVLIFMQDALTGNYKLRAESGLGPQDDVEALELKGSAGIVEWLSGNSDALVREEMARRVEPSLQQQLETELNNLKVNVCVPMSLDGRLVGLIGIGEKLSREMFFVSDLRVLETLATEVALAVKYRRMEDEVSRKNRLVELGTIAAGVAHEIRNPLASIKTFAQLMPDRMDDLEFKNEFSKLVLKDVDRITKVIESMLAFARPAQVTMGNHAANDIVEEAILLVQPRLKSKKIELTREFHGNPAITVDKHQILQVLVNILSNATDALHERGRIRVATGVSQRNLGGDGNRDQTYAVIEISDNGPGIPATVRSRLFDPFFTTKKEGTGLGLSISQKIIRDHGGAITVSSVEGKGTSFQVNLPLK